MKNRVKDILSRMVDIESITGNEAGFGTFVARHMEKCGYQVTRQNVSGSRFNIVAVKGRPRIFFCTHLDTVAPFIPFSSRGDLLKGRGTCDAKGSMAAMILAGEKLAADGVRDIGYLFVAGEETISDGAKKAVELGLPAEYIILGEPTGNLVASAQKGTLVFKVEAQGIAGHSALPSSGRSAVHRMTQVLSQWLNTDWGSDPARGETTLNIGTVSGGTAANVIAPECEAEGIFRVATSVQDVKDKMAAGTGDSSDVKLSIVSSSEPLDLTRIPGIEHTVVSFGSDAPYLKEIGDVVMCGPGSIQFAHSENEQITIPQMVEGIETYCRIFTAL